MSERTRPTPIIETILPGHRVHLLGGASGSGKTTWLMQALETWRKGEPVFGYRSNPVPFLYLSFDRGHDDFQDTCDRLHIDPATYRYVAPSSVEMALPLIEHLKKLYKTEPFGLVIVEGFANLTPQGKINDQQVVGRWLRQLQEMCEQLHFTLIGVLHSPKTKERDRYKEPRAKIAGCGAWAGYASTVIIIEEKEAEGTNELRELMILPRNARKHKYTLDFVDGLLVEVKSTNKLPKFVQWLATLTPGSEFTIPQAKEGTKMPDSTLYMEIERAQKPPLVLVEKARHGIYRVVERSTE